MADILGFSVNGEAMINKSSGEYIPAKIAHCTDPRIFHFMDENGTAVYTDWYVLCRQGNIVLFSGNLTLPMDKSVRGQCYYISQEKLPEGYRPSFVNYNEYIRIPIAKLGNDGPTNSGFIEVGRSDNLIQVLFSATTKYEEYNVDLPFNGCWITNDPFPE